ncbi:hypothetical protein WR25_09807 [Diploscapter pachys]|uniref:BZIP domain-containing protein n=1 Tax=Diploscapter pachys TaxID=2018661 RepID=A0A2A2KG35_9BILA|nr:hypothetical protein WR25_09807 [Diploscapter pachys]
MPIPSNDYVGSVDDYSPQGWTESKIPEVQSQQCVTYPSQYHPNNHQPSEQMELSKKENTTRECSIQLDLDTVHDMSLNDLVDIVMQTVENVQKAEPRAKELDLITKKKEQNKRAAIRYREKQKQRCEKLKIDKEQLEKRNRALRKTVEILEKESAKIRAELLALR